MPRTWSRPRLGSARQIAQHEGKDAAVAVIAQLLLRIDPAQHLDGRALAVEAADLHCQLLARLEARQLPNSYRFVAFEPERLPGLPVLEHERKHSHADEIGAMDALERLSDHGAHAQEPGTLGGPVAAGAGAVLLAGEYHERHALRLVPHGRVVDRHRLARGIVDGVAALPAAHHDVLDTHIGEGAAHHHVVVAAARA